MILLRLAMTHVVGRSLDCHSESFIPRCGMFKEMTVTLALAGSARVSTTSGVREEEKSHYFGVARFLLAKIARRNGKVMSSGAKNLPHR